nr:ribonuclease H-like domain-containing protein [Tanacetum cinerariifolium]
MWPSGSTNPHNYDGNASFHDKEHDFDAKKPESEVILSPSSSVQSRKQDDKTKKEAKGKSHVESFIGYRDLSREFEDCSNNSTNEKMAQPTPRNYTTRGNHKQYASMTHNKPQKHMVPTAVLTQSKPVFNTAVRPVSAVVPNISVTRPRYAHQVFTKSKSPIIRHITGSPSPKTSNLPSRVTAAQASVVSTAQGNMSYLSDFEELNGGYVAFGGNPKGGKIFVKGKIKTGKLDFDDVYFVKELKFNLFSV